jgi:glycosyltransferase involved in cell wall biosynthesis
VTVLKHQCNLGKAAALRRGIDHALQRGATAVMTLDGDGQHSPDDIPRLLAMHWRFPKAIVIGCRLEQRSAIPQARYYANRIANFWIGWAAGQHLQDSQSGFRVYPATVLSCFGVLCDGVRFVYESEILIEAGRKGIQIATVPIIAIYGRHLRRSHFRQVQDIFLIVRMVAKKMFGRCLDFSGLKKSLRRIDLSERPRS